MCFVSVLLGVCVVFSLSVCVYFCVAVCACVFKMCVYNLLCIYDITPWGCSDVMKINFLQKGNAFVAYSAYSKYE